MPVFTMSHALPTTPTSTTVVTRDAGLSRDHTTRPRTSTSDDDPHAALRSLTTMPSFHGATATTVVEGAATAVTLVADGIATGSSSSTSTPELFSAVPTAASSAPAPMPGGPRSMIAASDPYQRSFPDNDDVQHWDPYLGILFNF